MKNKGLFISFEGPDGSGKSSVVEWLQKETNKNFKDLDFLYTREPGGTPTGEKIRDILLTLGNEMLPITEAFLFASSRAELFQGIGLEHIKMGGILVSDRYVDSSIVYQGAGRQLGEDLVARINAYATKHLEPDYTFFLMVKPEIGIKRITSARKQPDRLDNLNFEIHQRVYDAYLKLIKAKKHRAIVIDASQDLNLVNQQVYEHLEKIIKKHHRV